MEQSNSYQLMVVRLINVCYRVYGVVRPITSSPGRHNHLHALQAMFERRLEKGQCHYTPFLGWKEFVPSYFGLFRETTTVERTVNEHIPSMLLESFAQPGDPTLSPNFVQDVEIKEGVLRYDQ